MSYNSILYLYQTNGKIIFFNGFREIEKSYSRIKCSYKISSIILHFVINLIKFCLTLIVDFRYLAINKAVRKSVGKKSLYKFKNLYMLKYKHIIE